uniref:Uncharacterized protein n=1 Tax=Mycena chlorophos TaxID=658473 RepID=A0ABQ0MDD8_MYCCL|nr:predicted protein [Mycena chlorophos]
MDFVSAAQNICNWCTTEATLSVLKPVATSVLKLCSAAAQANANTKRSQSLAELVVRHCGALADSLRKSEINPNTPKFKKALEAVEKTVDSMQSVVESRSSEFVFWMRASKLEKKFKQACKTIKRLRRSHRNYSLDSSDFVHQTVDLGAQLASAALEAPILNTFKVIPEVIRLGNQTAMTVKANRCQAVALAQRAEGLARITESPKTSVRWDSLELNAAVQEASELANEISQRSRSVNSWVLASSDKDRLGLFSSHLNEATLTFAANQTLQAHLQLDTQTKKLSKLVLTVGQLEAEIAAQKQSGKSQPLVAVAAFFLAHTVDRCQGSHQVPYSCQLSKVDVTM